MTLPYIWGLVAGVRTSQAEPITSAKLNQTSDAITELQAAAAAPLVLASRADADAPNGSLYYSTTQSKPVFKDAAGVVNALY